jgi:hypothetical protein
MWTKEIKKQVLLAYNILFTILLSVEIRTST